MKPIDRHKPLDLPPIREGFINRACAEPDGCISAGDRLRAAEQPPTPPAGRGEERKRMEDIRDAHTGRLTYLKINGFRLSATDEHIRDLLAFIDSRDAVIADLVGSLTWIHEKTFHVRTRGGKGEDWTLLNSIHTNVSHHLASARPFTKETR